MRLKREGVLVLATTLAVTTFGIGRLQHSQPETEVVAGDDVVTTSAPPSTVNEWRPVAYVAALQAWRLRQFSDAVVRWQTKQRRPKASAPRVANPPPSSGQVDASGLDSFMRCVMQRESGGNPRAVNRSSGAGGLFQFLPSTWVGGGYAAEYGVARAEFATPEQQIAAALNLYAKSGRRPWAGPGC